MKASPTPSLGLWSALALLGLALAAQTSSAEGADGPSSTASDTPYTVQIGALKQPSPAFSAPAQKIGALETSRTAEGLTRYRIGRFASAREATTTLEALRAAGYRDAYVVRTGAARPSAAPSRLPHVAAGPPGGTKSRGRVAPELADLPAELRSRVVYLDGELHVKDGERFVPLHDYRAR